MPKTDVKTTVTPTLIPTSAIKKENGQVAQQITKAYKLHNKDDAEKLRICQQYLEGKFFKIVLIISTDPVIS